MTSAPACIRENEVVPEVRIDDESIAVLARSMGIRGFARSVSATVTEVLTTGLPVILTNHGRPVAAIVAIADLPDGFAHGRDDFPLLGRAPAQAAAR